MSEFDLFSELKTESMHDESNMMLTENGAIAYQSMGSALVDIDSAASTFRMVDIDEIKAKMDAAYKENPQDTTKWMFYLGDIREGKGERRGFNACMDYMVEQHPEIAKELIPLIPEYTRWDYAARLMKSNNPEVARAATDFVKDQLKNDMNSEHPSLLAKWLPSIQTKKKDERQIVFKLEKEFGLDHKGYRKMLAGIRDKLNIMEKYLSTKTMDQINMENLTSHQNLKYQEAFQKWVPDARKEYLDKVAAGEAKMNTDVVTPHEIVHAYTDRTSWDEGPKAYNMDLETMWKMLPDKVQGDPSTLVIRDGSGSMTSSIGRQTSATCLEVATAMSIYFAERQTGPLADQFITFSSNPQIVDMSHCDSLHDKLALCSKYDDCSNTNLEKTFDLLLDTLKKNHATQEDVPKNILIVSDMEFDMATTQYSYLRGHTNKEEGWSKSLFETISDKWKEEGYELPTMLFWHVNADRVAQPMIDNDRGLVLLSGFSTNVLDMVISGEFENEIVNEKTGEVEKVIMSPEEQLAARLSKERYDEVEKAFQRGLQAERGYKKDVDISIEFETVEKTKEKDQELSR